MRNIGNTPSASSHMISHSIMPLNYLRASVNISVVIHSFISSTRLTYYTRMLSPNDARFSMCTTLLVYFYRFYYIYFFLLRSVLHFFFLSLSVSVSVVCVFKFHSFLLILCAAAVNEKSTVL